MSLIEDDGIRFLENSIQSNYSIKLNSVKNDKNPIWDGRCIIYKYLCDFKRKLKNEDFLGEFPIQIKCHKVKSFTDKVRITRKELK